MLREQLGVVYSRRALNPQVGNSSPAGRVTTKKERPYKLKRGFFHTPSNHDPSAQLDESIKCWELWRKVIIL